MPHRFEFARTALARTARARTARAHAALARAAAFAVATAVAAALTATLPARLAAQGASPDPRCVDPSVVGSSLGGGDACQKVVDLYTYLTPQLGLLVTGGNATLGQGGTLGGLGHFTIGIRGNVLRASIPDVQATGVSAGAPQQSSYATNDQLAPMPVLDASFGIFKGISLGVTRVGGLDLLLSAQYLPEFSNGTVDVTVPDGPFKFGVGGRLGILEESLLVPGVSVTVFRRDLPTVTAVGTTGDDSVALRGLSVKTTAWRVVASKSLLLFGIAAGGGQDIYDVQGAVDYVVREGLATYRPAAPFALAQKPTRTNLFVDLTLNLPLLKVLGEVGRVSGGNITTYNRFDPPADTPRFYGTIGFRVRL